MISSATGSGSSCVVEPTQTKETNRARSSNVWQKVPIEATTPGKDIGCDLPVAESLVQGTAVIVVPKIATTAECAQFVDLCTRAAEVHREQREAADLPSKAIARLPTVAAHQRAREAGTPCAEAIPKDSDAIASTILERAIDFIDDNLPELVKRLFATAATGDGGGSSGRLLLGDLYRAGRLEFSSREPAINVYWKGGEFLAHKDHQAITVLIPLSSNHDFRGGGTGFWGQDSRGHRAEGPALVLRPDAGTAMLFGGHVTHAGIPVEEGTRVVFVASFSQLGGRKQREIDAAQSRDIYGDLV
eukprot:CAMPEP_0172607960 /NCGR_PEP_ID=MMETSP1068-20121228/28078_1 /TAXON_ID=35684 /ORGANISM="Pseudopedinella elastica, Strain CCMP716" /LENGTH=301 /DNA_ID=CAMNT_0013411093 /DNA_START=155 /DNA_END=1060 /DNA_ORIENTATION=-